MQVGFHQPVDHFIHFGFNALRHIRHHPLLEFFLDAGFVQQVQHPWQAQGLVEILLPALLHPEEHIIDIRHAEVKVSPHILLVDGQLRVDILQCAEICFKQLQARAGDVHILIHQMRTHPQGIHEF